MLVAVLACALGGVLGSAARHGVDVTVPHHAGQFPWTTVFVNVSGCLLIGVLMVVLAQGRAHRLVRPFLGVGVLGGYTTYSAFAVDAVSLAHGQRWGIAVAYVAVTVLACAFAVWLSTTVMSAAMRRRA